MCLISTSFFPKPDSYLRFRQRREEAREEARRQKAEEQRIRQAAAAKAAAEAEAVRVAEAAAQQAGLPHVASVQLHIMRRFAVQMAFVGKTR